MIDWIKGAVPERKPESKKEVSTLAIEEFYALSTEGK